MFATATDTLSTAEAAALIEAGSDICDADKLALMWASSEAKARIDAELLRRERARYSSVWQMPVGILTAAELQAREDRAKEDARNAELAREATLANAELRRQQAQAPMIERQRVPEKGTPEWVEFQYPTVAR